MSSNNDDTILPTRRPLNSGGINGDTVLPSQNATGIHAPGDVIDNRYTVIREIGRGGMGVVYEVEDAITGDHYAVKRLLPAFASRPEILQQFRTEGAASIRFTNQSRYFVSTQTVGLDDGHPYIVMQLVRYPTLRNRLDASGGSLRTEEALPVLMEIAEGLAELHSLGYIHRDLKPDNVFIHQQASDVHVMLVDFGLTKYGSDATATALGGVGTERYASPEQKKGLPTTATSDIYSFGVVAFEVLTGELPGVGDQVTDYTVGVPPEVASIIMQCLSTRPERRPKDGGALRAAMIGSTPAESPLPQVAVAITAPKSPPTKLSSSLRFPDLQVGAKVVIDGESLAVGRDYRCELDEGTTKSVAVVVTWEGVDLFRDSVVLRAGDSKAIPTRKAYRIDCDVPDWCEVKDAKGQRVVFPDKGLLPNPSKSIRYALSHQGRVFESLAVDPKEGGQRVKIPFGIGTLRIKDVPDGCQVRVNHYVVSDQFSVPIPKGSTVGIYIRVYDNKSKEIYRETLQLQANDSKQVRVPTTVSAESLQTQVPPVSTEPQTAVAPTPPEPVGDTSNLTRRLVIGGGVAAALVGGGWFVCNKDGDGFTRTYRNAKSVLQMQMLLAEATQRCEKDFPLLSSYLGSMCLIPSRDFMMGGTDNLREDEHPRHRVSLSEYMLGKYPVTVGLWKEYSRSIGLPMPVEPDWSQVHGFQVKSSWGPAHPVVNVSWFDIMGGSNLKTSFCVWASAVAGIKISIPTEAQFEFAARSGKGSYQYPWGDKFDSNRLWCSVRKLGDALQTAPVTRSSRIYQNVYGLTDLIGNVEQWCSDYYETYGHEAKGQSSVSSKVKRSIRGGAWDFREPVHFRCSNRSGATPDLSSDDLGFRLVCDQS